MWIGCLKKLFVVLEIKGSVKFHFLADEISRPIFWEHAVALNSDFESTYMPFTITDFFFSGGLLIIFFKGFG